jgi:chromosome transmission fidelity protein 1
LVEANFNKNYILFSVMGGKLSEGINFSDRLARSIIVFGLPYSNMYGAEIAETMTYYDKKCTAQFTGKKYY